MFKQLIKKILVLMHIDLTKNMRYDRLTLKVLDKVLQPGSNCIDIGCHKGEILTEILKRSPEGEHYAFEPIPHFFKMLKAEYQNTRVHCYDIALSNRAGTANFFFVVDAPAYSGLKKRDYNVKDPKIENIKVRMEMLDKVLPDSYRVDCIKLDVEGAEFDVLRGAEKTLKKNSPFIIFEFGLGASNHYQVDPLEFYNFMSINCNYNLFLLADFLKGKDSLTSDAFVKTYHENIEYYFIASPKAYNN